MKILIANIPIGLRLSLKAGEFAAIRLSSGANNSILIRDGRAYQFENTMRSKMPSLPATSLPVKVKRVSEKSITFDLLP
jgi:hypothetical protein